MERCGHRHQGRAHFRTGVALNKSDITLEAANTAKTGVEESDKSADQVDKGTKFVTTAEMKALTDAIAAVEAAKASAKTPAGVTAAVNALNTADDTFNN